MRKKIKGFVLEAAFKLKWQKLLLRRIGVIIWITGVLSDVHFFFEFSDRIYLSWTAAGKRIESRRLKREFFPRNKNGFQLLGREFFSNGFVSFFFFFYELFLSLKSLFDFQHKGN